MHVLSPVQLRRCMCLYALLNGASTAHVMQWHIPTTGKCSSVLIVTIATWQSAALLWCLSACFPRWVSVGLLVLLLAQQCST
jgi:hypothetical protein